MKKHHTSSFLFCRNLNCFMTRLRGIQRRRPYELLLDGRFLTNDFLKSRLTDDSDLGLSPYKERYSPCKGQSLETDTEKPFRNVLRLVQLVQIIAA